MTRTRRATGEALLAPPRKRRSHVQPITSNPGKWADGERVTEGSAVAPTERRHDWLMEAVPRRLREELAKLDMRLNEEKSRIVDLSRGESFGFLSFDFRRIRSRRGALAAAVHAEAEEAHGVAAGAQGGVPALPVPAGGGVDRRDQPEAAGLGQLLPDRACEPVLCLCEAVGRAEGAAPPDAGEESSGLRLEEVEYGGAL